MQPRTVANDIVDWPYGTFLSRLTADTRQLVISLGVRRHVGRSEVMLRQGDRDSHVILLREGFVKVTATTVDGRDALLGIRMSGDVVGEMSALGRQPRSATVTACAPCVVNVIHRPELDAFLTRHPDASIELLATVADRLRWANELRVDFASYSTPTRLARVLVKIAMTYGRRTPAGLVVGIDLTQVELASLCGAAEVTVQKALRALKRRNVIRTGYRHITVVDLPALMSQARLT